MTQEFIIRILKKSATPFFEKDSRLFCAGAGLGNCVPVPVPVGTLPSARKERGKPVYRGSTRVGLPDYLPDQQALDAHPAGLGRHFLPARASEPECQHLLLARVYQRTPIRTDELVQHIGPHSSGASRDCLCWHPYWPCLMHLLAGKIAPPCSGRAASKSVLYGFMAIAF